jgi:hypothetical protein
MPASPHNAVSRDLQARLDEPILGNLETLISAVDDSFGKLDVLKTSLGFSEMYACMNFGTRLMCTPDRTRFTRK